MVKEIKAMNQKYQEFNEQRILSHGNQNETIEETIERIKQRIIQTGDKPHVTVARQLELHTGVSRFSFRRIFITKWRFKWILDRLCNGTPVSGKSYWY